MPNKFWKKLKQKSIRILRKIFPFIKIGQRKFESCKPFFLIPPRNADRITCCCKLHVDATMLLQSCMEFRRKQYTILGETSDYPVFERLSEVISKTLCEKQDGEHYHRKECLERQCSECGVETLKLMAAEMDVGESAPLVKWSKYEFVNSGTTAEGKVFKAV